MVQHAYFDAAIGESGGGGHAERLEQSVLQVNRAEGARVRKKLR
jgi:hypothetical protein